MGPLSPTWRHDAKMQCAGARCVIRKFQLFLSIDHTVEQTIALQKDNTQTGVHIPGEYLVRPIEHFLSGQKSSIESNVTISQSKHEPFQQQILSKERPLPVHPHQTTHEKKDYENSSTKTRIS